MQALRNSRIQILLCCFLGAIFIPSKAYAQETSKVQSQASVPQIEKTYVHTDRNYYTVGESLWYKAYMVYAYTNVLYDNSNVLYVELISPDAKIIAQHKIKLDHGLGHGDFKLTEAAGVTKEGSYQLRAYTNWGRNFGDDFVFTKDIEIIAVFNQRPNSSDNPIATNEEKLVKNKTAADQNNLQVQFFPEGGSLIENVSSTVAFKAVDRNGLPVSIQGKVFDSDKKFISLIASVHDGMGKFKLTPLQAKSYHAIVTVPNGKEIEIPLPKANQRGYALSYIRLQEKDIITIKTNSETLVQQPNEQVTLICATRGITYFEGTQSLSKTSLSFELPKTTIPEGISQITLYDANLKPQTERLVYVEKEHAVAVEVATDKSSYTPKEKVVITVTSKTKTGAVVPASFSISSTDMNGIATKDYGMNVCSYFLMESDIKGKIHNPGYYFDSSNPNRLQFLDLLLLTQGWRDFLWKIMPKVQDSITYPIEKGMAITGIVKQLFGKKPKENSNVTLSLISKGKMNILNSQTDRNGKFEFKDLDFKGETTVLLNARDEKGRNSGMLVLDDLQVPAMEVNSKNKAIRNSNATREHIKEEVYKKHVMFGVPAENVLDEVEIIAKKKNKNDIPSLYGNPDRSFVIDDKTPYFSDIYQLIQYAIPGVSTIGQKVAFNRYGGPQAHVIIDGIPLEPAFLTNIQVNDVAKVEAMNGPSTAIFGTKGANGVILIYTKRGEVSIKEKETFHSIQQKMEGYYDARVFYSPDMDHTSDFEMPTNEAIRNTLYWNPYVHPDETGSIQMHYYNSEVETQVKVALEGITATGIPIAVKTYYTIEK